MCNFSGLQVEFLLNEGIKLLKTKEIFGKIQLKLLNLALFK